MSFIECFDDVGCETFVLMDRNGDEDTHFLRKVCKDKDGNTTVIDLELDGITSYQVTGTVLSAAPKINCSATVISKELVNFPGKGNIVADGQSGVEVCAEAFLRHYVYDCEGLVTEVYDTKLDGIDRITVNADDIMPSGTTGLPSVTAWEWPYQGFEQLPDTPRNDKFWMKVAHPKTGAEARIYFESARAGHYSEAENCNIKKPEVMPPHGRLTFPTGDTTDDTFVGVALNSKFTFKPNEVILKEMNLLRLEFHDLDSSEAVVGLTPWPINIVDAATGDKTNLEIREDIGGIRPAKGVNDVSVYVYYEAPIPEEIYHYYNKKGTRSCHYASFTGYSVEHGCCSGGCEEPVDIGCETSILMDRPEDGSVHYFMRKVCKERDGTVTTTDTELDGETSYEVTGAVYPAFDERDCETITMMDQQTDGTVVYFLRKVCKQLDGTTATIDLQLDGQEPYSVSAEGTVYPAFDQSQCETFILTDILADGSEHPFLRKICKGLDGAITTTDFELDGTQTYTVEGIVVPPSSGGDCAATVNVIQLYDIAPKNGVILDETDAKKICGVPFLRHYTYDCEGKIDGTPYDTDMDGNPYKSMKAVAAVGNGVPSVKHVVWPSIGYVAHENDNGNNNDFWLRVKHPKTGEIGQIHFYTKQPAGSGCGDIKEKLSVNAPGSNGQRDTHWNKAPGNNSKFRFESTGVVKQMDMFRLEFHDLDNFEGVWGLTPWPDAIVDSSGSDEHITVDKEAGAIKTAIENLNVYAYYYEVPDVIEHNYHNFGGGKACHTPSFVGYTLEPGPCCTGCGGEEEEQEQEQSAYISRCAEQLTSGFGELITKQHNQGQIFEMVVPPDGYDLISAKIECLDGSATVETGGVAHQIGINRTVSWQAPGSGQILPPIKITVKDDSPVVRRAFVTWIARSKGEGPVELCDVTPEGTAVTADFDVLSFASTRTLSNGVTVTAEVPGGNNGAYFGFPIQATMLDPVTNVAGPAKVTFSQPVDIEIGVHFMVVYGKIHSVVIPVELKNTWVNTTLCTWNSTNRVFRMNAAAIEGSHPNPDQLKPAPTLAKFEGKGITELVFTQTGLGAQVGTGLELDFMKVTAKTGGSVKFRRYTTYDVGGNVMCVKDETLDGRPYQVKGKVGVC